MFNNLTFLTFFYWQLLVAHVTLEITLEAKSNEKRFYQINPSIQIFKDKAIKALSYLYGVRFLCSTSPQLFYWFLLSTHPYCFLSLYNIMSFLTTSFQVIIGLQPLPSPFYFLVLQRFSSFLLVYHHLSNGRNLLNYQISSKIFLPSVLLCRSPNHLR